MYNYYRLVIVHFLFVDMPESYATAEIESREPTTQEAAKPRKLFRKRVSNKPALERQTSQMCSVM